MAWHTALLTSSARLLPLDIIAGVSRTFTHWHVRVWEAGSHKDKEVDGNKWVMTAHGDRTQEENNRPGSATTGIRGKSNAQRCCWGEQPCFGSIGGKA